MGHFLGLPDLYDYGHAIYSDGNRIGSYGIMANSWGFDGSQYYVPNLSAWCKHFLGWVNNPQIVGSSSSYSIGQACENDHMIMIEEGYPSGKYLLIENRQPCGFKTKMPQGGLATFHIDENANDIRGYPGQYGWPVNGNHYKVALLQADGYYALEKGLNVGDSRDLFHEGFVNPIEPEGTSQGAYPNTKVYQSGNIIDTEINPSTSVPTKGFSVKKSDGENGENTIAPTSSHTSSPESYLDDFDFYSYLDSGGYDFGHQDGGIEVVAERCALDPDCKGFNSNGWMKHTLQDEEAWTRWTNDASEGFYKKRDTDPNDIDYLAEFQFYPPYDSWGKDIGHFSGSLSSTADECFADPNCDGFNSDGWLKHTIPSDQSQWYYWTTDPKVLCKKVKGVVAKNKMISFKLMY